MEAPQFLRTYKTLCRLQHLSIFNYCYKASSNQLFPSSVRDSELYQINQKSILLPCGWFLNMFLLTTLKNKQSQIFFLLLQTWPNFLHTSLDVKNSERNKPFLCWDIDALSFYYCFLKKQRNKSLLFHFLSLAMNLGTIFHSEVSLGYFFISPFWSSLR